MRTDVILRRFEKPDEVRELTLGKERCDVEHLGLVVSGVATAAFADGRVIELRPGDLFYIPPEPHDSWVAGDAPYVSLHFMGAERYVK